MLPHSNLVKTSPPAAYHMSSSATLRPFLLSGYQPQFFSGNPATFYEPIYNSSLDSMTSVSSRVGKSSSATAKLFGIRKYRADLIEGSRHPIQRLMKQLQTQKVTQSQMLHLLIPSQAFYHEECKSFYTVSEHAFISLGHLLLGTKESPNMIGPDDVWSIVQQALNGLHFLISQQLVHTGLKLENILVTHDGVVKIGAIRAIKHATSTGWVNMVTAVIGLTHALISGTRRMCLSCIRQSDIGRGCCDYSLMSGHLDSLKKRLGTADYGTADSAAPSNRGMREVILGALHMDFIHKAKGSRLAGIAEYAFRKGFAWGEPVSQLAETGRRGTSFLRRHNQLRRKQAHRGVRGRRLYGGLEERFLNRHARQRNIRPQGKEVYSTPSAPYSSRNGH